MNTRAAFDQAEGEREAPQLTPDRSNTPALDWIDSRLAQHLSTLRDAIKPTYAVHRRIIIGATTSVTANTVVPLVMIPRGRMYNVLAVSVTGVDPFTAAAQPAVLCAGRAQLDPTTGAVIASDVISAPLTAPALYVYNIGSIWLHSGQDIYAVHRLGAAINVTWTVFLDDWPENEQTPNAL